MLDEFTALSGYHRKHAVRLLKSPIEAGDRQTVVSRRIYDQAVKEALTVVWEAADRICGKRLKAVIPQLVDAMEKRGHLVLEEQVRAKILAVSAATIDRLLLPVRQVAGTRRKKGWHKKVSRDIAIKTHADWRDPVPGHLEIDFVVHGGGSMSGEYLHSLVGTDVCSGWVEAVPLLAREQSLVTEGLTQIGAQLPVPMLGIDSDNDGAFINDTLVSYCEKQRITFTRSRPHMKNDQAWIEQKNGAVIRKIVGHERFSGIVAGQALAQLYQVVRLYVNYFQPSFKLRDRIREGSKVRRIYFAPSTPCDRLLAHPAVDEKVKEALRAERDRLDPLALLHRIRQGQSALAALSSGVPTPGPDRQCLDEFLAALPQLWRTGEVRPTHRRTHTKPHYWRTREDPFCEVWAELLLWLQDEPDCTAKSLFLRLNQQYPGRFAPGQLRTLQRRVSEWRLMMARKLVFGAKEEATDVQPIGVTPPA